MHFKNACRQGGVQFSYDIILGGYSFHTPHFSENPRPPLGRNKRSVPSLSHGEMPVGETGEYHVMMQQLMQIQYSNKSICFPGLIYCDRT